MKRSYLIQRLLAPSKISGDSLLSKLDNAFSFGGGLVNGGLSKDAMNLLRPIFSFDYMGSAEFEWGAVPKALSKMVENRSNLMSVALDLGSGNHIYLICNKADVDEIGFRIREWAKKEPYGHTKEAVNLNRALSGDEYSKNLIGWLELDNGFIFFKDKSSFNKMVSLFNIK